MGIEGDTCGICGRCVGDHDRESEDTDGGYTIQVSGRLTQEAKRTPTRILAQT